MTVSHSESRGSGDWRNVTGRLVWVMLTLAALGVGIVSLRYLMPTVPFPGVPSNWALRKGWVMIHATFSSVAIMTGPWQFLSVKGGNRRAWHRWLGRIYLAAVLVGGISSFPIALHAQAGGVAQLGFLTLGVVWIATSALAYTTVRKRRVQAHRRWMIRSYALTCSAITLRIMIPLAGITGYDFDNSYPVIAWACWIVNLALSELWLRFSNGIESSKKVSGVATSQAS